MQYFLDCEFDGFGGPLMSLALVREDGESLYLVYPHKPSDPWVKLNVAPIMWSIPSPLSGMAYPVNDAFEGAHRIAHFLKGDPRPYIVTDWPDDVRYFCQAVITAPGEMAPIPSLRFEVVRVDAYPTDLKDCIQHNAWHDARALRHLLMP